MRIASLSIIAAAAGVSIFILSTAQQSAAARRPALVAFESPRLADAVELALPEGLAPAQRISFPPVVVVGSPAHSRLHTRR